MLLFFPQLVAAPWILSDSKLQEAVRLAEMRNTLDEDGVGQGNAGNWADHIVAGVVVAMLVAAVDDGANLS